MLYWQCINVQSNYVVVLAYQYTTITSAQVFMTIPNHAHTCQEFALIASLGIMHSFEVHSPSQKEKDELLITVGTEL